MQADASFEMKSLPFAEYVGEFAHFRIVQIVSNSLNIRTSKHSINRQDFTFSKNIKLLLFCLIHCPTIHFPTIYCPTIDCLTLHCPTIHCPTIYCPTIDCLTLHCPTIHCPTIHFLTILL